MKFLILLLVIMGLSIGPVYAIEFPNIFQLGPSKPEATTPWKFQNLQRLVEHFAEKNDIDRNRWFKLIELESNWDRFAVSKRNASGLCQVWPPTARAYGMTGAEEEIVKKLMNPLVNIRLCARILSDLLERYDGDWFRVAIAFNAGPGVVTYAQRISREGEYLSQR